MKVSVKVEISQRAILYALCSLMEENLPSARSPTKKQILIFLKDKAAVWGENIVPENFEEDYAKHIKGAAVVAKNLFWDEFDDHFFFGK